MLRRFEPRPGNSGLTLEAFLALARQASIEYGRRGQTSTSVEAVLIQSGWLSVRSALDTSGVPVGTHSVKR